MDGHHAAVRPVERQGAWDRVRARLDGALERFTRRASVVPSSPALGRAIARCAELGQAAVVVELGPGTGSVTRELLAVLPAHARLFAIDLDPDALARAVDSIRDPRLVPVCGDAASLRDILDSNGQTGPVDAVVSCLGLSMMPDELRGAIVDAALAALAPGGRFVQFLYMHGRWATWGPESGWSRFNGEVFLRRRLAAVHRLRVWRNVPPADIFWGRVP